MSSNHQVLPEPVLTAAARIQAQQIERVVSFIDRFTAKIIEKLEAFEKITSASSGD
ncbi:MAG TPA: hypothetical protein VFP59_09420 [Candidatus Angelobacter sp.]|nr:hypothetical protein [Candidatus Angelobacter sp.]